MVSPNLCHKKMGLKCLIIAAGDGSRLQKIGDSKPLIPILGIPLIERVIRTARDAGAGEFYVVTGYQSDRIRAFLNKLSARLMISITLLMNDDWEKGNGLSVLKARKHLQEPFLLLMADHLLEPAMVRKLIKVSLVAGEVALGVDRDTRNSLINIEDVTRVSVENGKITDIGSGLTDFNGFDTGVFLCSSAIFDALEQSQRRNGDTSLSAAVRILAAKGKVIAINLSGFWIDVDDPEAFRKAEKLLLNNLCGKFNDGPVSRYLNRPISLMISRRLSKFDITPNQISLFSFLCSVLAAGLFALGGYSTLLMGGVLAQFASIIDGSDGEVARLKYQKTDYGGWFDAVLDRYADAFLLFGLTLHLWSSEATGFILSIGFMAIIGSFMLSYTADKYDKLMRNRIARGARAGLRMGRDVRVFLIFLGAASNLVLPVLTLIAVVMNFETLRRLLLLRSVKPFDYAKQKIRSIIAGSRVPEDPRHSENTLKWLLRLEPKADDALQIAALAHDMDRAIDENKVKRTDFENYDAFKAAHARHGSEMLYPILTACGVQQKIVEEACRLVTCHEVGGDPRTDLLKDADSISFFDVNLPLYFERESWHKAKERSTWGYGRLSKRAKEAVKQMIYKEETLTRMVREVIDGKN